MSRSSLRTVTEISIDGQAVDAATKNPGLSFRVNCDSLSWVGATYYDNTEGTVQSFYYPKGGEMIARHNGEIFHGSFGYDEELGTSPFKLGHDYTGVFTIYQNYPESAEDPLNTGPGKYDVLLGSGRILELISSNTINIGTGIGVILPPVRYEGRLIGGCMLENGGVQTLIESYDSTTGIAVLEHHVTPAAGSQYYLVSNYLRCDPFYWYCRSDPEVTLTAEYTPNGLKLSGSYSQQQETAMRCFAFSVENETGDKSFTYTFEDHFPIPAYPHAQTVICDVETQEDQCSRFTCTTEPNAEENAFMLSAESDPLHSRAVRITADGLNGCIGSTLFIWRCLSNEEPKLICAERITSNLFRTFDYTAVSGRSYTYRAAVCRESDGRQLYSEQSFTPSAKGVLIAALKENGKAFHRRRYSAVSVHDFNIGSEQGSITSELGTQAIKTLLPAPTAVFNDDRYSSGTITVYAQQLGSITSPVIDGDREAELERFFGSKQPFLVLDNTGNVHITAITSLMKEYDYSSGLTRFVIGWVEVCSVGEALVS